MITFSACEILLNVKEDISLKSEEKLIFITASKQSLAHRKVTFYTNDGIVSSQETLDENSSTNYKNDKITFIKVEYQE